MGPASGLPPQRVACLVLPRFLLQVAAQRQTTLLEQITAVHDTHRLLAVSAPAAAAGLRVGMSLIAARERCPTLRLVVDDPAVTAPLTTALLRLCAQASQAVELAQPGVLFLDWDGTGGTATAELELAVWLTATLTAELALSGQVGIADGPFTAAVAGRTRARAETPLRVPPGQAAAFLAPFELTILPGSRAWLPQLRALGLQRVGELAALPASAITTRFGPAGLQAHRLANGHDRRPLRVSHAMIEPQVTVTFTPGETLLDRLLFSVSRALDQLWEQLTEAGLAAEGLIIQLTLDGAGPLILPVPLLALTGLNRLAMETLRAQLSDTSLPAPITALTLRLTGVGPVRGHQLALTEAGRASLRPQQQETVGRLLAWLGPDGVCRAWLRPSFLPEQASQWVSWTSPPPTSQPPLTQTPTVLPAWPGLRWLTPAHPVTVTLAASGPTAVHDGTAWRPVTASDGPYRVATSWWSGASEAIARDYYLIADPAGNRRLLMINATTGHWAIVAELD